MRRPRLTRATLAPGLLFVVLAAAFTLVWSEVRIRQRAVLRGQTEVAAEQAAERLAEAVRVRLTLVDQIRREWVAAPFESREAFERRSLSLQAEFPGYLAVSWIDPAGVIRWVVPREPNRAAENQDLHFHPFAAPTFVEAERTGLPRVTPPVELYQGGLGLASYFPIIRDGSHLGYVNGVFRIRPLIEAALQQSILASYSVRVSAGDTEVFTNRLTGDTRPALAASAPLRVAGQAWRLTLAPGPLLLSRARPLLPDLLLVLGLVLAAISAWFSRLYLLRLEEVARSEEKYRGLVEDSMDVVYISTPDGRLLDINPAGVRLFGARSKEEILAAEISRDLYADPNDRDAVVTALERDGFIRNREVKLRGLDGRPIRARFSCTAVRNQAGHIVAYRGVLHDETEQLRLHEQIAEMQRMESLSNLAGGIAHDFNNTLGAILGRASLLKDRLTDPESRDDLEAIEQSVDAAAAMTSRLLAFARGDVQQRGAVDVNDLVRRTLTILRRTISPQITIETDLADHLPPVSGNDGQLQQVLLNLCVNARDAMPEGGTLWIRTRLTARPPSHPGRSAAPVSGPAVVLTVTDTGVGMTDEVRRHAFEPFFTTKPSGRGTGLGLAVVFGIVTGHGGMVWLDSEPAAGSTVSVCLPASAPAPRDDVEPAATVAAGGSETILVADDDDALRATLRTALVTNGYTVLEARDGQEAVEEFRSHRSPVDVVLLDMTMPRLDGVAAFLRLREVDPSVRVIVSTGYGRADGAQELLDRGAKAFLHKPYRIEELLAAIRRVLDTAE